MKRRGDTWSTAPFSWLAAERPDETYQSIENPTQLNRIPVDATIPIETVAPRVSGWFGVRSILYFFFGPLIWLMYYCYFITPLRGVTAFVFLEVVVLAFGIFYFLFHYPAARKVVQEHPLLILVALFVIPILTVYDNLAIRLHVSMFIAIFVANLYSDTMLNMATCFPYNHSQRILIRSYWSSRYKPSSRQVAGIELHWLSLAAVIATPTILLLSFVPSTIDTLGSRFLLFAFLLLFISPWIIEKFAALIYQRPSVSMFQMVSGFSSTVYEWLTYQTINGLSPGVFQPDVATTAGRRRLTHAVLILLTMSAVPFVVIRPMIYHEINQRHLATLQHEGTEIEPATPLYKQKMLSRMTPTQRREYTEKSTGLDSVSDYERNREASFRSDYAYSSKLLFLASPIVQAFFAAAPWILSVFSPFILFFGFCFALTARVAAHYPVRRSGQELAQALASDQWNQIVDNVTHHDPNEPSLFLGVNAYDNAPVIVPRKVFNEHAHIQGDTGSGKTSLGLSPLLTQLVRQQDCSVVVVDLKGDDLSLFNGLREEADSAGLDFKWFSNQLDRSTCLFNPLQQKHFSMLSPYQRTDVVLGSLGLQYGTDYGRSYFSDANSQVLYQCFRNNPRIASFRELADAIKNKDNFRGMSQQLLRDGAHLQAIISRLASWEPLNVTEGSEYESAADHSIEMVDAFEKPSVYYFYLSAALGTTSSAEMARLALFSLLSAAKFASQPRRQVYLCIDEFQRITSKNLELFLQTARSFNIGVILANQTLNDLRTSDVDLATTVKANCRVKQHFSASDPVEIAELSRGSGETVIQSASQSLVYDMLRLFAGRMLAEGVTISEQVVPRLSTNQILLAGDHPLQSILQIRRGAGTAQYGGFPFVMRGCHHIDMSKYQELQQQPWPLESDETITPRLQQEDPEFDIAGYELHESPLLSDSTKDDTQ